MDPMKAWWAARDLRTKVLIVAVIVVFVAIIDLTYSPPKTKPAAVATKPPPVTTTAAPVKCATGTHLTKLGWCLSNKPAPAIQITAADREAAAVQNDATVCAGDAGCAIARPLKRKLIASGAAVQSMTCINDVGTHLKCLASFKDGSTASYDVTVDATTGQFIYQASS